MSDAPIISLTFWPTLTANAKRAVKGDRRIEELWDKILKIANLRSIFYKRQYQGDTKMTDML